MTLAIARNSRRSILPALALPRATRIAAGTRLPLLLNMVIFAVSRCFAFTAFTISHPARVVKDVTFWRTVALDLAPPPFAPADEAGVLASPPALLHLQGNFLNLIGKGIALLRPNKEQEWEAKARSTVSAHLSPANRLYQTTEPTSDWETNR